MLRSLEHVRGTTPAKRQIARGMQIFSEDFTVDAVCTTLSFVLKYQDFGPLETSSGTALFVICMIRIMPSSMLLFVMPLGTGFD